MADVAKTPVNWGVRLAAVAVFGVLLMLSMDVSWETLIERRAIGLVLGGTLTLLVAGYGLGGMRAAVAAVRGQPSETGAAVFRSAAVFTLALGFVGMTLGFIEALQNLDDPNRLGPCFALSLMSQLYGVTLALLAHLGHAWTRPRQTEAAPVTSAGILAGGTLAMGALSGLAIMFLVMRTLDQMGM